MFSRENCGGPRGIAAAVATKNSPPDCFFNVATVLQEIISALPKKQNAPFYTEHFLFISLRTVIFALRRVVLLRSGIRQKPSYIRFASFKGEYNITFAQAKISLCKRA